MPTSSVTVTTMPPEPVTCADLPCLNGGTCRNVGDGFDCLCDFTYYGKRCEEVNPDANFQFSGTSYLKLDRLHIENSLSISLSLSTDQENAVIFYAASDYTSSVSQHYIRLLVKDGILRYQFSCMLDSYDLDSNIRVNVGEDVQVTVTQYSSCKANLQVNSSFGITDMTLGMPFVFSSFRMIRLAELYIGGIPPGINYVKEGALPNLIGCVGHVIKDGRSLSMVEDVIESTDVTECGNLLTTEAPPTTTPPPLPLCADVTCDNGATCRDVQTPEGRTTFYCDCPLHFQGVKCEQEIAVYFPSFQGNSYLEHRPLSFDSENDLDLYLSLKTSAVEGTVLYCGANDGGFVQLYLDGGELVLVASCGEKNVHSVGSGSVVNNDTLIGVNIRLHINQPEKQCTLSLQLENTPAAVSSTLSVSATPPVPLYNALILGGGGGPSSQEPSVGGARVVGLVGCVRHLQVNGEERLVFQDAIGGANVGECEVAACSYAPCRNNGSFQLDGESWFCECHDGYTGALCERHACHYEPCEHGGTCIEEEGGRYVCLCPFGRRGINCSEELTVTKPSYIGEQYDMASFVMYPRMRDVEFELAMKFKFSLSRNSSTEDQAATLNSSLLLISGEKSGVVGRGSDYIAVGLQGGHVVLRYDLGSGMADIRTPQPINTSLTFHTVQLGRKQQAGWLKVDDQSNATGQSAGNLIGLNLKSELYVGGHDYLVQTPMLLPSGAQFENSFVGCIYELEVRGGRYGRWHGPGDVMSGRNVGDCDKGECELNGCHNGGRCVDHGASFSCQCEGGWKGQLCKDTVDVCDEANPCTNGSTCHSDPNSGAVTCDCPIGVTGEICNQNVTIGDPRFIGERSYMAFHAPRNLRYKLDIEIQFKPAVETGLLLYMAEHPSDRTSDFWAVELNRGHVQLRYNTGTEEPTVVTSNSTVNSTEDVWHSVRVGRNQTHGYISLDGELSVTAAQPGMTSLDITTMLFLGGLRDLSSISPWATEREPMTFEGCVRLLSANQIRYELSAAAMGTELGPVEGRNVVDCDASGCGLSTCRNGGTCTGRTWLGGVVCTCTEAYVGEFCETAAVCVDHGCADGSTCRPQPELGTYVCDCPIGRSGQYCQQNASVVVAHFTGDSYVYLDDPDISTSDPKVTYISLNFSTTQTEGVMLWNGEVYSEVDDYLGLGLSFGRLKLVINLGWWDRDEIITGSAYNDGRWHSLILRRKEHDLKMYVDGALYSTTVRGNFIGLDTNGKFYLGGFPAVDGSSTSARTNGHFQNAYVGALRDVRLKEDAVASIDFMTVGSGANIIEHDGS